MMLAFLQRQLCLPSCSWNAYTLSEIAAHLDIHYTTVSKVANENGEN